MQLLKITTVPIKFREQENVSAENNPDFSPENAEVNSANVRIPVKNTHSSKNNPEMYDGHVVGNKATGGVQQKFINRQPDSMRHESASETEGNEYSVNYCYGKKNVKPEPKPTCAEYMRQNIQSAATIDSAIDSMDSVVPDKSWEPEPKEAPKAVKIHAPKPQPRKIVEEYAHVEFEYLGG
ncbi:MAG: hypothetical protein IKH50_04455, partial [Oscillospiraceae bacterium]|nr:hypothetical protein [Oscillospiraceae bacterium]